MPHSAASYLKVQVGTNRGKIQIEAVLFASRNLITAMYMEIPILSTRSLKFYHLSHLVEKPTMWFPNRSDTNRPVQARKRARSLRFRV